MYDATEDPYCYPGTDVLRNRLDLRDPDALSEFEAEMSATRAEEPLPSGRFTVNHYRAVHRHLFQDVYPWAGRFRTVRISKGGSPFCFPEHIEGQMRRLFSGLNSRGNLVGLDEHVFADEAARFLAELNAIHPFREGNGRAQMAFMGLLSDHAGHPLNLGSLEPASFLEAMIASFHGDEAPLAGWISRLMERPTPGTHCRP